MKGEQTLEQFRRIRRSSEYQRTRREGKSYQTTHFVVIINPAAGFSRLGTTVSRRVGNAVCRNRVKRWLRDFFRNYYKKFGQIVDVSIIAKKQAGHLSRMQVDRELKQVFARLETDDHV